MSDPARPRLLDEFQPALILDASAAQNPKTGYWQDEDMDIDTRRKLIIGALDPRHDDDERGEPCTGVGTLGAKNRDPDCRSGFFVISYGNPRDLRQVGDFVELPAGHTASCINDCDYVWTGGPARRSEDQGWLGPVDPITGWGDGRPIWVTDMRNARKPKVFGNPIDLYRNDGRTDYSHDVQVDEQGIAWVSGRGGIRGYATKGTHRDPTSNLLREATPWDPILVAGGGVGGVVEPETMFMHNSWRPTGKDVKAKDVARGNILIGTEEEFNDPDCDNDGRLVLSDLTDSWGGEPALNSTPGGAVPDEAARHVAPGGRGGQRVGGRLVLGPLLRAPEVDARPRLLPAGPAAARPLGRKGRASDRLLARVDRQRRHGLELVGRRLARQPRLPVRHEPRDRGPAAQAAARRRPPACARSPRRG